jgi:hypothetical protein
MTSKTLKSAIWLTLVASAVALAAPGGGKGPPDGKGNKPTSEVGNNLSVPAIIAGGGSTFAITCDDGFTLLAPPDKDPVFYPYASAPPKDEGEPIEVAAGYYYVQRDAKWQAPCSTYMGEPGLDVTGKWGDNLAGGSASLKVGSPIRVEFLLLDGSGTAVNQKGYFVIKLEPSELDRESDYGHLAAGSLLDGFEPIEYTVGEDLPDGGTFPAIVFDPSATLRIERLDNGVPVSPPLYNGIASGEINSTGKIVYGYNLRVQVAGTYRITYTFPRVTFVGGCNVEGSCSGNEAVLEIMVAGGGGGGKKGPK